MNTSRLKTILPFALILTYVLVPGCGKRIELVDHSKQEATQALVDKWADQLDQETNEFGAYIRPEQDSLASTDLWKTRLRVSYSQDGASEQLTVRSAGADREFNTQDDITASRIAVTFEGVGKGIKNNAAEVANEAARGVVKGTVDGIKSEVRDAFGRLRRKEPSE